MLAQIAQRFAAIDRRSNGSHRVSLVYNAASNPNPNPISLFPRSLLPYHPSLSSPRLLLTPLNPARPPLAGTPRAARRSPHALAPPAHAPSRARAPPPPVVDGIQ
jgi:hypothetical protein